MFEPVLYYTKAHKELEDLKKRHKELLSRIESSKTLEELAVIKERIERYRWMRDKFGNLEPEVAQAMHGITGKMHYIDDLFSTYESRLAFLNGKLREEFDAVYNPFRNELDNIKYNHFKGKFSVISIETAEGIAELKDSFDEKLNALEEHAEAQELDADMKEKIREINLTYWQVVDKTKKAIRAFAPHTPCCCSDFYAKSKEEQEAIIEQMRLENIKHIRGLLESGDINSLDIRKMWEHYKGLADVFFIGL